MRIKAFIPNSITFLNLFSGFASIYLAFQGNFTLAATAIMLATIFDMLDGRLARMMNVHSSVGKELDSFSDLVTFGMAPTFFFYNLAALTDAISPFILLIVAFFYLIAATMRLACYNVKTGQETSVEVFSGMPSTFAGISVASLLGFDHLPALLENWIGFSFRLNLPFWALTAIFLFYAVLMVSKIPYPKSSSRVLNFLGFSNILYNIGFFTLLIISLKYFLFVITIIYTISPFLPGKKK